MVQVIPGNDPESRGRRLVQALKDGTFQSFATMSQGVTLRATLRDLEFGTLVVGTEAQTWAVLREMVRQVLGSAVQTRGAYTFAPGRSSAGRPSEVLTPSRILLGTVDSRFGDIGATQVDGATARLIGLLAPSLEPIVPQAFYGYIRPPGYGRAPPRPSAPAPSAPVHVEVNFPMDDLREAVRSGVAEGFKSYRPPAPFTREYVEERVHTGPEGTHKEVVRGAETEPRPVFTPSPEPAPPPPPAPTPTSFGVFSVAEAMQQTEPPKTRKQVSLFGDTVQTAAAPVLEAQLEDKYRPLHLREVIGNPEARAILTSAAQSGRFSKAYLLTGPPGIGKTSSVLASIRDYLDTQAGGTDLYNAHYSVNSPTFGISPGQLLYLNALDLVNRGGASALLGAVARFTKNMTGQPGLRRFVILDDITKFTAPDQQALLPLLERNPTLTFFIVVNDSNFIDALRSRTQELRYRAPEPEEIQSRLLDIMQLEGMTWPDLVAEATRIVRNLGRERDLRKAVQTLAQEYNTYQQTGELPY